MTDDEDPTPAAVRGWNVHKKTIAAFIRMRVHGHKIETEEAVCGTFTQELERLRDWLRRFLATTLTNNSKGANNETASFPSGGVGQPTSSTTPQSAVTNFAYGTGNAIQLALLRVRTPDAEGNSLLKATA
ncbi:MAG: hypothetical protein KIT09_12585 [Bryobacteraceae bacterium]|nr:hypothetical protein [Bryobacteraceae bacterium]